MTEEPFDLGGLDPVSAQLVELVLRIVGGDFTVRGEVSGSGDGIDAVIIALNMLAESFEQAHLARARAEALLADAVDAYDLAPDAFCSLDVGTLRIVKGNATLARMLAVPLPSLYERSVLELVQPAARPSIERALRALVETGTLPPLDVELVAGATTTIASMTGAVKLGSDGQAVRLLLALRDETENRRLTTQLVQAQRLDALGKLAGGIAHDFNNLLTVILASAELLRRQLGNRPAELEELSVMRSTAERAALLVRDLLAFARKESAALTRVIVDDVVRSSESMLARLAGRAIEVTHATAAAGVEIVVGAPQLGQAIVNLVVNARDAMPAGGRITIATRAVEISAGEPEVPPGHYLELTVGDTGPGIPPEVQARMFEPFFTTKSLGHGTGLGLSIVYGVVRQAHGFVKVSSTPGGTTFALLFPIAGSPRPVAEPPPTSLAQTTLLVIEDDDLVRALTLRVLRSSGFRVLEANRGDVAIRTLRDHLAEVALVISDVAMPELDGVETLVRLRELRPDLSCLFVTGYAREEARILAMARVAMLPKPFAPDHLVAKVREMLATEPRS